MTLTTSGPLAPSPISQTIVAPSLTSSKPARRSVAIGRNASCVPSAGVTKPKPLLALNHFTLASTRRPEGGSSVRKKPGRRSYMAALCSDLSPRDQEHNRRNTVATVPLGAAATGFFTNFAYFFGRSSFVGNDLLPLFAQALDRSEE